MDTLPPAQGLAEEIAALRAQLAKLAVNLSGKDWLTVEEAAFYCGVSVAQFYAKAPEYGVVPRNFMGKKLFEKAALYRSISGAREWTPRRLTVPASAPTSPEMASAVAKLASYEKRRGRP